MTRRLAEALTLGDGSQVLVRAIVPSDKAALEAAFEQLSKHSRHMRFLAYKTRLSSAELDYFTEVDHIDHEALIATDSGCTEILAIARYVRLPSHRQSAEVAVTVADDWQGRGLGAGLLSRLADRAREHGICRFEGQLLSENRRVIELLKTVGALDLRSRGTVTDFVVELSTRNG